MKNDSSGAVAPPFEPKRSEPPASARVHDDFFDAAQALHMISGEMSAMASAFAATGNSMAAERLWQWADDADVLSKKITDAATRMLDERLADSRQAASNMIGIAFALLDPDAAIKRAEAQ